MTTSDDIKDDIEAQKLIRLEWIRRIYNSDVDAISQAASDEHLLDNTNFDLKMFIDTYRPLTKLKEARGDLDFVIADIRHPHPDVTFMDLCLDGEPIFEVYVRFEDTLPCHVKYWMSYPPLPEGVTIRKYDSADAPRCVELERACPMEMLDGSTWIIDRGEYFDDYLSLMSALDAAVIEADGKIVGFYDCALRPISFQDNPDAYCVYQHHYRVHPDYRSGSVSQALASYVDPRRSFEAYDVQFPYSMVDPNNAHLQNMGFPPVPDVAIARLSIPVNETMEQFQGWRENELESIVGLINTTHGERAFFQTYTQTVLAKRLERVKSYNLGCFRCTDQAVLGVWQVNERNYTVTDSDPKELRLAFVMDYGYASLAGLLDAIDKVSCEVASNGATHLCFLCDTRADEFAALASRADDIQRFAVHTLPWLAEAFTEDTLYCDAVYC